MSHDTFVKLTKRVARPFFFPPWWYRRAGAFVGDGLMEASGGPRSRPEDGKRFRGKAEGDGVWEKGLAQTNVCMCARFADRLGTARPSIR